jgi:hypothetical protein
LGQTESPLLPITILGKNVIDARGFEMFEFLSVQDILVAGGVAIVSIKLYQLWKEGKLP